MADPSNSELVSRKKQEIRKEGFRESQNKLGKKKQPDITTLGWSPIGLPFTNFAKIRSVQSSASVRVAFQLSS